MVHLFRELATLLGWRARAILKPARHLGLLIFFHQQCVISHVPCSVASQSIPEISSKMLQVRFDCLSWQLYDILSGFCWIPSSQSPNHPNPCCSVFPPADVVKHQRFLPHFGLVKCQCLMVALKGWDASYTCQNMSRHALGFATKRQNTAVAVLIFSHWLIFSHGPRVAQVTSHNIHVQSPIYSRQWGTDRNCWFLESP